MSAGARPKGARRAAWRTPRCSCSSINLFIAPLIGRLKERLAGTEALADIELLENRLARITSPLMSRLSTGHREFTLREREIAALVMEGKTSKEIAEHLCLTIKTVDFHRMNLRKKLRMANSGQSLRARLSELDGSP